MKKMAKLFIVIALIVISSNNIAMSGTQKEKQNKAISNRLSSPASTLWQSYLALRLQKGKETLIVYAAPYLTKGNKLDNGQIERFEIVASGFVEHGWRPVPSTYDSDSDYQVHAFVKYDSATGVEIVNYKKNRRKIVMHSPGFVKDVVKAVEDIGQLPPLKKMQY